MRISLGIGLGPTLAGGAGTPPSPAAATDITLTASSVRSDALAGSLVAYIFSDGYPAPSYSEFADPDNKFTVSGNQLLTSAAMGAGPHSVTIRASNASGDYDEIFPITVVAVDTTPDAFTFTDITGATVSTVYESNTITVAGINDTATVTITGGEYSKNGGAYTSTAGTAVLGDTFKVRHTSSGSVATATNTVLTIGGVSDTYTTTTVDTTPDAFAFTDVTGATISTVYESNTITVAGITGSSTVTITGGEYSKNGGSYTSAAGTASNGDTFKVRHTSSASYVTATDTVLTIGGVSDTYTTTTTSSWAPLTGAAVDMDFVNNKYYGQRTNSLAENFWTDNSISNTSGSTAHDGGTSKRRTVGAGSSNTRRTYQTGVGGSTLKAVSFYYKAGTVPYIHVRVEQGGVGNWGRCIDLSNDALTTGYYDGATASSAPTSVTIETLANGWRRYKMAVPSTGAIAFFLYFSLSSTTTQSTFAGTEYADFYGHQVEDGVDVTPLIITAGSAVTVTDANCSLSGLLATTRASTGTVTDSTGLITTVAANTARRSDEGLLIEESRTNLFVHSQDFTNAAWSRGDNVGSLPATANATTGADGQSNADKLTPNTANEGHYIYQTVGTDAVYTLSVAAKPAGYNWISIFIGGGSNATAYFNVSTGTVGTVSGTATDKSAVITPLSNGYYRCSFTADRNATAACGFGVNSADNTPSFAGNASDGIYVDHAQFELGSFATSRIVTAGATATRNLDDVDFLTSVNTILNGAATTAFVETGSIANSAADRVLVGRGTVSNGVPLMIVSNNKARQYNGTSDLDTANTISSFTSVNRAASAWTKTGVRSVCLNGGTVATNTDTTATPTTFTLGSDATGIPVNGRIRRVALWATHKHDYVIQQLTANGTMPTWEPLTGSAVDMDYVNNKYYGPRTNNCIQSRNPHVWSAAEGIGARTDNAADGPNGVGTADLVTSASNLGSGVHPDYALSLPASSYTFTLDVKPGTGRWIRLESTDNTAHGGGVWFDLLNGVVGTGGGSGHVLGVASGSSIAAISGFPGWYRCKARIDYLSARTGQYLTIRFPNADNTLNTTAGQTYYLSEGQFEPGTEATPHIVTAASPVTTTDANCTLSGLLSTTRASTGTVADSTGALTTVAANTARRSDEGLLVEEARTNIFPYSQEFDNAGAWTPERATISANAATSPDGTLTADKLVEDSSGVGSKWVFIGYGAAATTHTVSIYLKAAGRTKSRLSFATAGLAIGWSVAADLGAGTVSAVTNYGGATGGSATITDAGNGWYRVSLTVTNGSATFYTAIALLDAAGSDTYTGDGASGMYLWGAQIEIGSFATSYIPTTTAAATRNLDDCDFLTAINNIMKGAAATAYVETQEIVASGVARSVIGRAEAISSASPIYITDTSIVATWNSAVALATVGAITSQNLNKMALAYTTAGGRSLCRNGGTVATDAGVITHPAGYTLGSETGGAGLNGRVRRLALWSSRRSDATLITVTT